MLCSHEFPPSTDPLRPRLFPLAAPAAPVPPSQSASVAVATHPILPAPPAAACATVATLIMERLSCLVQMKHGNPNLEFPRILYNLYQKGKAQFSLSHSHILEYYVCLLGIKGRQNFEGWRLGNLTF